MSRLCRLLRNSCRWDQLITHGKCLFLNTIETTLLIFLFIGCLANFDVSGPPGHLKFCLGLRPGFQTLHVCKLRQRGSAKSNHLRLSEGQGPSAHRAAKPQTNLCEL
jgi:hypothetical protein